MPLGAVLFGYACSVSSYSSPDHLCILREGVLPDLCNALRDPDLLEAVAAEGFITDADQALGKGDFCEAAVHERPVSDMLYAFGNCDRFEAVAEEECEFPNGSQACGKADGLQGLAALKGPFPDGNSAAVANCPGTLILVQGPGVLSG